MPEESSSGVGPHGSTAAPQALRWRTAVGHRVAKKWVKSLKWQCLGNDFVVRRNHGLERHKYNILLIRFGWFGVFFNVVVSYNACKVVKRILLNSEWHQM